MCRTERQEAESSLRRRQLAPRVHQAPELWLSLWLLTPQEKTPRSCREEPHLCYSRSGGGELRVAFRALSSGENLMHVSGVIRSEEPAFSGVCREENATSKTQMQGPT